MQDLFGCLPFPLGCAIFGFVASLVSSTVFGILIRWRLSVSYPDTWVKLGAPNLYFEDLRALAKFNRYLMSSEFLSSGDWFAIIVAFALFASVAVFAVSIAAFFVLSVLWRGVVLPGCT
ncbi:MAG TPA: hypothetical protein VGH02_14930 [Rhizomicrobium sp.]|jgi:hypothetical protein